MKITRTYYPIEDAATMIGCSVDDLIHLGANWELQIWVTFDRNVRAWVTPGDKTGEPVLVDLASGLHQVSPLDLEDLESGRKDWLSVVRLGNTTYRLINDSDGHMAPSRMFIMTADIEELTLEAKAPVRTASSALTRDATPTPTEGVTVVLPHLTRSLEAVFKVMWENWKDPDPRRLPKQINIARELDVALGYKSEKDDTPSRNAKAIAAIIKPDVINGTE